jgi:hypothetical protein
MKVALVARVKQGDLWEALQKRGWSQRQGAEFLGIDQSRFGDMINLRKIPQMTPELEVKLYELTGKTSEELFPEEFRAKEFLEGQRVFTAFGACTPDQLVGAGVQCLPARSIDDTLALRSELSGILGKLTTREREVVIRRFGLNGEPPLTLEDTAEELEVTRERVRQVEIRAKKKLRHIGTDLKERGLAI